MTNRSRLHQEDHRRMRCRRPLTLSSVIAVAAFALLAAGCGGGGRSAGGAGVASSTTATTTTQNGLGAFSNCMRSNGVPDLPAPQPVRGPRPKAAGQPPAAQRACNHLLPNGGDSSRGTAQQNRTRLADMLSFAKCMRGHGLTRFPDPTAQGDLSVEMVQAQGIDVHSPAVLRVVQACLPASHGLLTPAKVRGALNNAGG